MKKLIVALIAIITVNSTIAQTKWEVDKTHSSVDFSITHLLISEVSGNFKNFKVTAIADDDFKNPTFEATIDPSSINTNNEMRDNHLKANDFFDAKNHKKISFTSTSFKQIDDKKFELMGNITVKGITKPITFSGKLNGIVKDPRSGKLKAGLKLTTELNREMFNIGKGMNSISDEVEVTIRLEMNKQ